MESPASVASRPALQPLRRRGGAGRSGTRNEFRSRCSLDDAPALAASWEAALHCFPSRPQPQKLARKLFEIISCVPSSFARLSSKCSVCFIFISLKCSWCFFVLHSIKTHPPMKLKFLNLQASTLRRALLLAGSLAGILAASSAQAATIYWDGTTPAGWDSCLLYTSPSPRDS